MTEVRKSYLLYAGRDKGSIFRVHPLEDEATTIASPGRLCLGEDPFIGPEGTRVVEVNGVVQTDHHANLWHIIRNLLWVFTILDALYTLDVCLANGLALQLGIVHLQQCLEHVFADAGLSGTLAL